jgi:hypothetical protein
MISTSTVHVHPFSSQDRKELAKNTERVSEREKKQLANGFVFLLANPEFYSHLARGYPHPCNSIKDTLCRLQIANS